MRPPDRNRALRKLGLVIALIVLVLALLVGFVRQRAMDGLVNHLTLGLLVALIVIVNLISCLVLMVLFAAWRWVKRDLAGVEEDDQID